VRRREQRQPELKFSRLNSTLGKKLGCFAVCAPVRRQRLEERRPRRGVTSALSLLCSWHRATPFLPDKEVTLGLALFCLFFFFFFF
jgi:hypothetical protein